MPDKEDLEWEDNYNCFQWARYQVAEYDEGGFPRIRQEFQGDGHDDERYVARRNKDIARTSKFKLLTKKNAAEAVIASARAPRIPANILDGNAAMNDTAMVNTLDTPMHIVLAILRAILTPADQIAAVYPRYGRSSRAPSQLRSSSSSTLSPEFMWPSCPMRSMAKH